MKIFIIGVAKERIDVYIAFAGPAALDIAIGKDRGSISEISNIIASRPGRITPDNVILAYRVTVGEMDATTIVAGRITINGIVDCGYISCGHKYAAAPHSAAITGN